MSKVTDGINRFKAAKERYDTAVIRIVRSDPWVPIEIGGHKFKLEFSYGAAVAFFKETGVDINSGQLTALALTDTNLLFTALLHGLGTHQMDMDAEYLGKIFKLKHRAYYALTIQTALEATQPDESTMTELLAEMEGTKQDLGMEDMDPGPTDLPLPEIVDSLTSGPVAVI